MKGVCAALIVLVSCVVGLASPPKLVGDTTVDRDKMFKLKVDGVKAGLQVDYEVTADNGKTVPDVVITKDQDFYMTAPPGTYTLRVLVVDFDAKKFDRGTFRLTVKGGGGGGDDPVPDDEDVQGTLGMTAELRSAWKLEPDEDKALLPKLISVYEKGQEAAGQVQTWGGLFTTMTADAQQKGLTQDKLSVIRRVIQKYLRANFPFGTDADMLAIDQAGRAKAKTIFKAVTTALGKLK